MWPIGLLVTVSKLLKLESTVGWHAFCARGQDLVNQLPSRASLALRGWCCLRGLSGLSLAVNNLAKTWTIGGGGGVNGLLLVLLLLLAFSAMVLDYLGV